MKLKYKGIDVFYELNGKGETIVLLHGFLENSSMWNEFIPKLSKTNQVITIDLLGHGNTACLGYIHTMKDMANAVHAVLQHLNIKTAKFIGHSMGGYVALAFAEMFSDKIKSLCLLNSTAQADSDERILIRNRAIKAAKQNYKALVSMSISNLFYSETAIQFLNDISSLKNEALKTPVQGYIAAQEGMKIRKDSTKIIKNGKFNTIYISGERDTVLPVKSLKKEALLSEKELFTLNGGHMSYIEDKTALEKIIVHFIEKI